MGADLDDDALLAGLASGDRESADVFVRRHAAAVIGVAFRVVGDRALAEDMAQLTFWRAWQAAATYDPRRGDVRTWLLAIARNASIDHLRVRRALPLDPERVATLLTEVLPESEPDGGVLAEAEAEEVRRALFEVPEDQRRALLLATVGGHTAAEVGRLESIPLGTAKTRIRAGLHRLRSALEAEARRGR